MGIIKEYKKYLSDNPEGYWFKRRLYGWGWIPAKWQGWAVLAAYVVMLILLALTLDNDSSESEVVFMFVLPLVFLTLTLIRICYKKGERPKWMWGFPKDSEK